MMPLTDIVAHITTATNNQFLSGGLVLGALGTAMALLRKVPRQLWSWFLRRFTIRVDVTSTDDTFRWVMLWMHKQTYTQKSRRLSIKKINGTMVVIPSKGQHIFFWKRRPVWVSWIDEEGKMGGISEVLSDMVSREKITIQILGRNRALATKLITEVEKLSQRDLANKLQVYTRRGSWNNNWELQLRTPRPWTTIFLPEAAQDIVSDVKTFLQSRTWYERLGIPYRRGYLLYGPPGSGKSSVALGLASELKLPLYVLNLAAISTDSGLEQAIYSVNTDVPTILLLEDIDTAMPDRVLDKQKSHFSLGTLLNLLDGVVARENLILIVTTNNLTVLDPALVRPGRIDRCMEFGPASVQQISSAIRLFFRGGNSVAEEKLLPLAGSISMAKVQEELRLLTPQTEAV